MLHIARYRLKIMTYKKLNRQIVSLLFIHIHVALGTYFAKCLIYSNSHRFVSRYLYCVIVAGSATNDL